MTRSDFQYYLEMVLESSTIILRNLERAAEQIKGFKQIAVDRSSEEKRTFLLKDYIEEVLLSLQPKLKKTRHRVTINCPEDIEIESYPGAFSQIITNFVMNSLLHGFEQMDQGEMVFDVCHSDDLLTIRYSDNGSGIPEDAQKKIFEPFFTTKRNQGGSGLGLNIIHNLVTHRLKGSISCESMPGEGTTFMIEIPLYDDVGDTNSSEG